MISKGLVPYTEKAPKRGRWLLGDMLSTFNPSIPAELRSLRERFLFHCGIPRPIQPVGNDGPEVAAVLAELAVTCESIVKAYQEPSKRAEVFERVDELYPEEHRSEIKRHLEIFFDGLGADSAPKSGILALAGSWGHPKQSGTWQALPSEVLRRLFDIAGPIADARVTIAVECPSNAILSLDDRFLAAFHGARIPVEVSYAGLPVTRSDGYSITLAIGRTTILRHECTAPSGTVEHEVDTGLVARYGSRVALVAKLLRRDEPIRQFRMAIHLCGDGRPRFAVIVPTYKVVDPVEPAQEEEVPKYEVEETAEIFVFDHSTDSTPRFFVGDDEVGLVQHLNDRVLVAAGSVDPSSFPVGIARMRVEGDGYEIVADLEAAASRSGEFTLEDELRSRIVSGSQAHLRRLITVFKDSQERYIGLGGMTAVSRARVHIGKMFERDDGGHLPICADMLDGRISLAEQSDGYLRRLGDIDLRSIAGVAPRREVLDLVSTYAAARQSLLDVLFDGSPYSEERPRYAELPVYVQSRSDGISAAIKQFLGCYAANIDFIRRYRGALAWNEAYLLAYLDCIVHWTEQSFAGQMFLLGPWHPLVAARRFMSQKALFAAARKILGKKVRFPFHALAALVGQQESFFWVSGVDHRDASPVAAYVSSTSDPGWLLCINNNSMQSLIGELGGLKESLGLEARVLATAREHLAESYMRNFFSAYPSRRSLSVRVSAGYASDRIIESAETMLYSEGRPTDIGALLPGGVHIFLSEDDARISDLPWRDPRLCIYTYTDDALCAKQHQLDIALLPAPTKIGFAPAQTSLRMARGKGDFSFLAFPLRQSLIGADGVPVSALHEWDTEVPSGQALGDVFVRTLHDVCEGLGSLRTTWRLELPKELQSQWNILQGPELDPAAFVQYVQEGFARYGQPRALWDYRISISKAANSYFILSRISEAIAATLNGSPIFEGKSVASELIRELGGLGLAIGGESVRSSRKALGVVGLVGAVRLFCPLDKSTPSPFSNDAASAGFLLPVDSFHELLGGALDPADESHRRADLVAIQLALPSSEGAHMQVRFSAVECKYAGGIFNENYVSAALEQATQTYDRLAALFSEARLDDGLPERLAVAALLRFGLRLIARSEPDFASVEHRVLAHVASGSFEVQPPKTKAILVSTECGLSTTELRKRNGWWLRLGRGHWPGVNDSNELLQVRNELGTLFGQSSTPVQQPTDMQSQSLVVTQPTVEKSTSKPEPQGAPIIEPQAASEPDGTLKPILIGVDEQLEKVTYDPQSRARPLDNYNVMITGSSGKGKTQLIKAFVLQLRGQHKSAFLLDFKNDFASDAVFCREARLESQYVTFDGLPYNPLIPSPIPHPATREPIIHCGQHITGLTAVLARAYGLGAQQEMALKDAIRDCYREYGLNPSGTSKYEPNQEFPDFNDAGERLRAANPRAYNRLDPLFDLQIFQEQHRQENFAAVLKRPLVIDLSSIQSDPIKNALAQMMVLSAHGYYNSLPHSPTLRQYLIFDEAHRVLSSEYLTRFVRECRAYGVGVVLSSQYPSDFGPDISASMSTKIIHGNDADEARVQSIANLLGMRGEDSRIAGLQMFNAIVTNPQYKNVFVRTVAYPHFLILRALGPDGVQKSSLNGIEGLDANRMPPLAVLDYLKELGLAEEVSGVVKAL